jgi:hypothetical protein
MPPFARVALIVVAAGFAVPCIAAGCSDSATREQQVFLSWNGRYIEDWEARAEEVHEVTLPNKFKLGLKIEPAPRTEYEKVLAHQAASPELVMITLLDMTAARPKELTHTYGGANSLQGYGAKGGADRVEALGSPGIELFLSKPVCVTRSEVAAMPTGQAAPN